MKELQILTIEEWKEIPNRPGYEASSLGRIRSIDQKWAWKFGFRKRKGKILTPYITKRGYMEVRLSKGEGKGLSQTVHKLVMWAFGPPKGDKTQINHKNGIKTDNRYENLEWCNNSENRKHAYQMGLTPRLTGERNPKAKLTQENVNYIRANYSRRALNQVKLASIFGVSQSQISTIIKNQTWQKS